MMKTKIMAREWRYVSEPIEVDGQARWGVRAALAPVGDELRWFAFDTEQKDEDGLATVVARFSSWAGARIYVRELIASELRAAEQAWLRESQSRETSVPIMRAIWQLAGDSRSRAVAIWEAPTPNERRAVALLVKDAGYSPSDLAWGADETAWAARPALLRVWRWRTDAASGAVEAPDADAAVARLVAEGEWAPGGSKQEARDMDRGAWLVIVDEDDVPAVTRGRVPR